MADNNEKKLSVIMVMKVTFTYLHNLERKALPDSRDRLAKGLKLQPRIRSFEPDRTLIDFLAW